MHNLHHNTLLEDIIALEEEVLDIEPTNAELQQIVLPTDKLEMAWCGGSKNRGCGNKFNLFHVRFENGYAICPHCGKRN